MSKAARPRRSLIMRPLARGIGWLLRKAVTATVWALSTYARLGWRHRRRMATVHASTAVALAAAVLRLVPDGSTYAIGLSILSGLALAEWIRRRWNRLRGEALKLAYAGTGYTAAAAWLLTLVNAEMQLQTAAILHMLLTAAFTGPWLWHHRIRTVKTPDLQQKIQIWDERMAAKGKKLPGTILTDVKPGQGNVEWEGTIVGEAGMFHTEMAVKAAGFIASAYHKTPESVTVEPGGDGSADTARVQVIKSNKLYAETIYDTSWHGLYKGSVQFTSYADGSRGRLALFVPGAGTRHGLFTGDSGTGKSVGMTLGLIQSTRTGLVVPWFACPQGGQSSPAWAGIDGQADYIARDAEQCVDLLRGAQRGVYARSALLAELPYLDNGTWRTGVARWDPDIRVRWCGEEVLLGELLPLMDVYADEIPVVFNGDPDAGELVADIVKVASKTGLRLNLAAQMPALAELDNRNTIRQNVKANVVAYRNSEKIGKGMVLSPWMPAPFLIPSSPPGKPDEHTLGTCVLESVAPSSSRTVFSRTPKVNDVFGQVQEAVSVRPALDEMTAQAIGGTYYEQWKVGRKKPKSVGERAKPEPTKGRERIVINEAADGGPRAGTTAARAVEALRQAGTSLTTSAIADAIGARDGEVSQALSREANRPGGLVEKVSRGLWALRATEAPADADDEPVEVTA